MTAAEAAARRLLDDAAGIGAERLAAEAATVDADALAWALKDACYAAWMREPALARRCADALTLLADIGPPPGSELQRALAAWTAGIAALTEGRMAPALAQLDAAGAAFTALGDTQHAAETEVPKLIALSMLGRHDEALQAAERAHSRFIATGDNAAAGKVELNLGSMLLHQDRYAEAAQHYRAAALRFARLGDGQHSVMADIGLATVLTWQFAFDDAELIYERAAERAMTHGLPLLHGVIASNRGRLELHRGRHAAALRWLEAALRDFEAQGNVQRLAEARRDLADAYLALNLLPEATTLYDAVINSAEAEDAPLEQAWAAVQRAQALAGQNRLDPALRDLATARALFTTHGNAVGVGLVALRRAVLDLQRGAHETALAGAGEASTAFSAAGIAGWRWDAEVLAAEALAAAGRHDEAAAGFRQTLEAAAGLAETAARCHTGLGLLQRARGDRAGARASLQRAVDTIEGQRASLHADAFRTAYGTDRQRAHEALVELALDDADPGAAVRQLQCMEQARARALLPGAGDSSVGSPEAGAARERWRWLHEQWQAAVAAGQDERAAALLQRERAAEAQWQEACRRADAAGAETSSPPAPAPARAFYVGALQAALPPGSALVAYMQLGKRWLACVATRDAVHSLTLPGDGLDDRIERLRFQLDTLRHGPAALHARSAALAERTTAHLRALHRQLWAPLLPWLHGAEHVIVVPHRALHCVPFCALHDGRHHLVEQHALSLAPSAALWLAGAAAPAHPLRSALAIGVGAGVEGPALPHVASELRQVAAAFDGRATVLLDGQATLPALRAALPWADVLHIACHGQFRADSPYFSSLHLADGPLTLRDAAALPLQAALVTLSACETGLNRIAPGDELLGLVRGFLLAGAPSVLASLWTVDDASTAALMGGFYRRLAASSGAPAAAQALREAQVEALATQPHPYFWAAFSLHGRG